MTLRCDVITDLETWRSNRFAVDDLLSTCPSATPHGSTTWLTTWWEAFGAERELRIGLFWRDSLLVGYAPLMLCRESFLGIPVRVLRFVGDGISDYADIFSREDDASVKEQIVEGIVERWRWDELDLRSIRGGSSTLAAFERRRSPRHFTRLVPEERCPYISLRGLSFEQYYRSLSKNHRRELQKRKHKLDALGSWTLDFSPVSTPAALFDEFGRLHRSRSDTMGWVSLYDLPGFRRHFELLMERTHEDIEVLCSTLRHGSVLMSYTLGFVRDGVYYHWNIGFDDAYEAIAPNKLHHQFVIEECFRRGYREFDFMRGAYEYKFRWTHTARENYGVRMVRRHGWRRPVSRVRWLREREPGSFTDRCIHAAHRIPALLHSARARVPSDA